jgi:hypothetical protein
MKYIYSIILLILAYSQIYAQSPADGLQEISLTGLTTSNVNVLKNVTALRDTITQIGWFKDRDCVWGPHDSVALPLPSSCWVSCGTGSGMMASCFNSGLGVFIYNPKESGKILIDSAVKDNHYLLADPQSKELIRAFLEQLPYNFADYSSPADQKLSVKVTGYWIKNGISANKSETFVPEISPDSVVHYLDAFHYLSIEGTVFPGDTNSWSGFATNSYKLTPQDLAPSNLSVVNYAGGVTVKFTPPTNRADTGLSNLRGYKVRVYSSDTVLQSQYTTIKNDTTVKSINIPGLNKSAGYIFTVSALYPISAVEVESEKYAVATGLDEIILDGISVYPTLSNGEINVLTPAEARIKVIDFTGKTIGNYQSTGSLTIQLNVPSGLYFVLVESLNKIFTQKVIIEK